MTLYTDKGLHALARTIQTRRLALGSTQQKVADGCELSLATIYRLETGDTTKTPTDTTLERISNLLGLSRDELKAIAEERHSNDQNGHGNAGIHNVVTEVVPMLDYLTEAQFDLIFKEIINHPSMTAKRLTQCIRMILDRVDSLNHITKSIN